METARRNGKVVALRHEVVNKRGWRCRCGRCCIRRRGAKSCFLIAATRVVKSVAGRVIAGAKGGEDVVMGGVAPSHVGTFQVRLKPICTSYELTRWKLKTPHWPITAG